MKLGEGYCFVIVHPSNCPNFISLLFLSNNWPDFNETLWKDSMLSGDMHVPFSSPGRTIQLNTYIVCPLISYALCIQSKLCFCAISQQLLIWFQWNFVRLFNVERWCTYHFISGSDNSTQLWSLNRTNYCMMFLSYAIFAYNFVSSL